MHDNCPTLKDVPGRPPVFVFAGESGKSSSLVRCRPLIFAPTVAKTVAIRTPFVDRQFGPWPFATRLYYKYALLETVPLGCREVEGMRTDLESVSRQRD